MEKKYRLLDVGEDYRDADEILTACKEWQSISACGVVLGITNPIRRPDDGKGNYVLTEEYHGTEFWRWGIGWHPARDLQPAEGTTIWRKPREVEKPKKPKEQESNWVVFGEDDDIKGFFKSEKDALDHLPAEEMMINERYYIAKIVKTVVVKMIVTEVAP